MEKEAKTENLDFTCSHYFGYLRQLSGGKETPDECLICKKLLECKFANPDLTQLSMKPKTIDREEVKEYAEESAVDTLKNKFEESIELRTEAEPLPNEFSRNQFEVENGDILDASESDTVCINSEELSAWGEKIRDVDIQTNTWKKIRCKVKPSEDLGKGMILIPEKIQLKLEIKKGDFVTVEPVFLLELEDKARDILQTLRTRIHRN